MIRKVLIGAGCVVAALLVVTTDVRAQDYPRRTSTPTEPTDAQIVVRGRVNCGVVPGRADRQAPVEVEGAAGTAAANEQGEVFVIYNPTVSVGTFTARPNGSFFHTFRLPPEVPAGNHVVRVSLPSRGNLDASLAVTNNIDDCVEVAGIVEAPSVAVDGGLLPRTGIDWLLLILWALILILVGTVLSVSSWRWAQRFEPVRAAGARMRRGPPDPSTLPEPEIPVIDTSDFDPVRRTRATGTTSRRRSSGSARPASEWHDKPRRRRKS